MHKKILKIFNKINAENICADFRNEQYTMLFHTVYIAYCIFNKYVRVRTDSMKDCIPLCNGLDFLFLLQWMNWKVIYIFKIF